VEWKLRQERGVFGVKAEGCAVEAEDIEHERRLEFQLSMGSGRCRGSLEPAGVLYTGTRRFFIHVERCGLDRSVESMVLKPKDMQWKSWKRSMKKD